MGRDVGILGQADPNAATDTDLYAVPLGNYSEVKVMIAERGGTAATIRIWIAKEAATTSAEQYIVYDETIVANEALTTILFRVNETDVIRVRSSTNTVSFTCTGISNGSN